LTPLVGGERRRDGSPDVTERVAGVVAQKLRYLELLLIAPWSVNARAKPGLNSEPTTLQIANPASYVVQKLLIHDRRKPLDRAKDVLHVHDTIELFATSLPALNEIWRTSISPTLSRSVARRVQAQREKMFGAVTDTIREAALMAGTRRLTPTAIQEACLAGLEQLLRENRARLRAKSSSNTPAFDDGRQDRRARRRRQGCSPAPAGRGAAESLDAGERGAYGGVERGVDG
jgi:hypothetical protein